MIKVIVLAQNFQEFRSWLLTEEAHTFLQEHNADSPALTRFFADESAVVGMDLTDVLIVRLPLWKKTANWIDRMHALQTRPGYQKDNIVDISAF